MTENNPVRLRPDPLPVSAAAWEAHRQLKQKRSLNDMVEECHISLLSNDQYVAFLNGVYDEDCIEGSLAADNLEAAAMIRDEAVRRRISDLANKKKATIVKALNVVVRRYGWSRKERRQTVGGQIVAASGEPEAA